MKKENMIRWKALVEIYTMHSFAPFSNINFFVYFFEKNVILELCKGVHCVDLGESFPTHIYLQNLASIQPRTSPVKFARPSRFRVSEAADSAGATTISTSGAMRCLSRFTGSRSGGGSGISYGLGSASLGLWLRLSVRVGFFSSGLCLF